MCAADSLGHENAYCGSCLVGPKWDALRAELGTELIRGYRSTVPTIKYGEWISQTLMSSAFRIILK
eukprot:scaffold192752_cov48-Prasinocladus_malaysianus.AAC.1